MRAYPLAPSTQHNGAHQLIQLAARSSRVKSQYLTWPDARRMQWHSDSVDRRDSPLGPVSPPLWCQPRNIRLTLGVKRLQYAINFFTFEPGVGLQFDIGELPIDLPHEDAVLKDDRLIRVHVDHAIRVSIRVSIRNLKRHEHRGGGRDISQNQVALAVVTLYSPALLHPGAVKQFVERIVPLAAGAHIKALTWLCGRKSRNRAGSIGGHQPMLPAR